MLSGSDVKHYEKLVKDWLAKSHKVESVEDDPPDFILDEKIAMETTSIHSPRLEPIQDALNNVLSNKKLKHEGDGDIGWFVSVLIKNDLWSNKKYRKRVKKKFVELIEESIASSRSSGFSNINSLDGANCEFQFTVVKNACSNNKVCIGSISDIGGAGFVHSFILRGIQKSIDEKTEKCLARARESQHSDKPWWLFIVNVAYSIGDVETFQTDIQSSIEIPGKCPFQKIVLMEGWRKPDTFDEIVLYGR